MLLSFMFDKSQKETNIFTDRSEEPRTFMMRLCRKYGIQLNGDAFDEEIDRIPGYEPRKRITSSTQIEFFPVAKGTKKEEIERICKELGYERLIDPLEFLHLIKRYQKYFYDHGDPNQIRLPYCGAFRTQWQNKDGKWYYMQYETLDLSIDRIWLERDMDFNEHEIWNFAGVKSSTSTGIFARQQEQQ